MCTHIIVVVYKLNYNNLRITLVPICIYYTHIIVHTLYVLQNNFLPSVMQPKTLSNF